MGLSLPWHKPILAKAVRTVYLRNAVIFQYKRLEAEQPPTQTSFSPSGPSVLSLSGGPTPVESSMGRVAVGTTLLALNLAFACPFLCFSQASAPLAICLQHRCNKVRGAKASVVSLLTVLFLSLAPSFKFDTSLPPPGRQHSPRRDVWRDEGRRPVQTVCPVTWRRTKHLLSALRDPLCAMCACVTVFVCRCAHWCRHASCL
jgi:hypothetical protein